MQRLHPVLTECCNLFACESTERASGSTSGTKTKNYDFETLQSWRKKCNESLFSWSSQSEGAWDNSSMRVYTISTQIAMRVENAHTIHSLRSLPFDVACRRFLCIFRKKIIHKDKTGAEKS